MENKQLKQTINKWHFYIRKKITNPRTHIAITELLKTLNNNQTHIQPEITQQSRDIIDKIVHAFSESLVTVYDPNLFESICDIIFTHERVCNIISDDMKIHIKDYITQTPWLATLHQGFIHTLSLIREYVDASHSPDSVSENILLQTQINESIYNIINCWVISCITLLFCKALFGMATLELNLPYLFFVAASYSIVDFAIDDTTVKIPIVKTILKLFEQGINNSCEQNQPNFAEEIPAHIFNAIRHLIQTYKHHADPNSTKLNAIFYSMHTEKECFKRQRVTNISANEIITLTINKGLSTGYLILAGLPQKIYDSCVNLDCANESNKNTLSLFNQYCILLQLLDDLSDYTQDSAASITTSAKLFETYPAFAWFVLDCLLDFLQEIQASGIFDKWLNNGFNIIFVNYWCYCCNKNIKLITGSDTGSDTELMDLLKANYMFDMEYVLQMRDLKHKKKYELYKLLIQGQLNK
jgi:hypothetical protein